MVRFTSRHGMPCRATHERAGVLKGAPRFCKRRVSLAAGLLNLGRVLGHAKILGFRSTIGDHKSFCRQTALEQLTHCSRPASVCVP